MLFDPEGVTSTTGLSFVISIYLTFTPTAKKRKKQYVHSVEPLKARVLELSLMK